MGLRMKLSAAAIAVAALGALPGVAGASTPSYYSSSPSAATVVADSPALQADIASHPGGTLSVAPMTLVPSSTSGGTASSNSTDVTPDNYVTGNCGSAWLYDTAGSTAGTINEAAGMSLDYAIIVGAGNIAWHNESKGNSNQWDFTVQPNIDGNWAGARVPKTGAGFIVSVFNATVTTIAGNCYSEGNVASSAWAS